MLARVMPAGKIEGANLTAVQHINGIDGTGKPHASVSLCKPNIQDFHETHRVGRGKILAALLPGG
jgi:hypothetical protein